MSDILIFAGLCIVVAEGIGCMALLLFYNWQPRHWLMNRWITQAGIIAMCIGTLLGLDL